MYLFSEWNDYDVFYIVVSRFTKKCRGACIKLYNGCHSQCCEVCKSKTKVQKAVDEIFKGKFKSSNKVVLEEFLEGEEASYFIIADNNEFKFFGTAQDHKRVYEKDKCKL